MGTLNVIVDGSGFFTYHVAPEAKFDLGPLDDKARARFTVYIEQKHPLPLKQQERLKQAIYLQETATGRTCGGCFYMFCIGIPLVESLDQKAWDQDVDTNELRMYITEQLAGVLPVGSWRLIESIQVGPTWAEGRTLLKLHIVDPSRREA